MELNRTVSRAGYAIEAKISIICLLALCILPLERLSASTRLICVWQEGRESRMEAVGNEIGVSTSGPLRNPILRSFSVEFTDNRCLIKYLHNEGGMTLDIMDKSDTRIICNAESFGRTPPRTFLNSRTWTYVFQRYTGTAQRYYHLVDKESYHKETIEVLEDYQCEVAEKLF